MQCLYCISDRLCAGMLLIVMHNKLLKIPVIGPEHRADANGPAQPSYCDSTIFHQPHTIGVGPPGGRGYISGDGHHFLCRNPAQLQQSFHVYVLFNCFV